MIEKTQQLMSHLSTKTKRRIGLSLQVKDLGAEFDAADQAGDGILTREEFQLWATNVIKETRNVTAPGDLMPPSRKQLFYTFLRALPPFIAFGFVDNFLMVLTGSVTDKFLGVYMSMMAAAALGNAFSNGIGVISHGAIEACAKHLGLPDPKLTLQQMQEKSVRMTKTAGSTVGVLVGCLMGMCPLLFMDSK
eukprot:gnl/TRDRNA2_/TRDRNA2_173647_c7_seq1.p1 gnl/TRDRNA2_/TRDRNA2_173647_c7~~gnl/TRDRNA2_/TRDRNA2_173647_c7_seq1.p1  ORF type:complete len:192 (+),score=30.99 gnl/TRDRNA2_/TRDRNA2_173647_c7_seq1:146-721(+)